MSNQMPEWSAAKADKLKGALVLVGITYHRPEDVRFHQFFGTVVSCDPQSGIAVRLDSDPLGEMFNLPPDTSVFLPAKPGEYRLRQTDEVVTNPDFTVTYEVHSPNP